MTNEPRQPNQPDRPSPANQTQVELITEYLDGSLDAAQREAFEKTLESEPALAAEVKFHKKLDASLNRLFEYAAAEATGEPLKFQKPVGVKLSGRRLMLRWIGVAAALVLAGVTAWVYFPSTDSQFIGPEVVYAKMQAADFTPAWRCENDQQFIDTVSSKLGEGLLIPADSPGLAVVGWAYSGGYYKSPISDKTLILIAKKDSDNVLLLVDRAASDRKLKLPRGSKLNLFRDTVGGLVLYEITPRSEPVVIPVAKENKSKATPSK